MRIGILIKRFEDLSKHELLIIQGILKDPGLEIGLLIQDGRSGAEDVNNLNSKIQRMSKSGNLFGKILFKIQEKIESKLLFKSATQIDRQSIINKLNEVPVISLKPERKGFLDIFSQEDADQIRKYDLDIILRHEFNIIRGAILNAAKYGIWSFHHGDNSINRGGPAGFWEIVLKQSLTGVTLQQLTPELDGGKVIDKAFFNTHWSYVKNSFMIKEGSVSLLFKNIKKLQNGQYNTRDSEIYYNPLYKIPTLKFTLKYLFLFYKEMLKKLYTKPLEKLGVRYNCWTLFIGKGSIFNATLFRLKPVKLPKGEFWADPFLYRHPEKGDYIYFENYSYKTDLGKISCGRLEKNKIVDVVDVLETPYHLSYPFIFEDEGELFMIPETGGNKRVEVYKCTKFPDQFELYSTAFEGTPVRDTSFYKDDNGQRWLFLNKPGYVGDYSCVELFIYRIDSLKFNKIEEHKQNPVIIDASVARNGGAIFKHKGDLIRPSQNNSHGIYGWGLNLNKIDKLSLEEYKESKLVTLEPNFKKGLVGTHHCHQIDDRFVIDAKFARL